MILLYPTLRSRSDDMPYKLFACTRYILTRIIVVTHAKKL